MRANSERPTAAEPRTTWQSAFGGWRRSSRPRVPRAALWLGALGALPFVFLAAATLLLEGSRLEQPLFALTAYGAVILSFLGGVHWGLASAGFAALNGSTASSRRLAVSVVPALVGWAALLLSQLAGLLLMAAAFIWLFIFDLWASRRGQAPAWYPRLRAPLTAVVVAALCVGALA